LSILTFRKGGLPMGRAKPVAIDTRSFESQSAAKAFFKGILDRYDARDRVGEADAIELRALLKRHTDYAEKLANGLSHFVVDYPPDYKTKCFQIISPNGMATPFSYIHCVDQIPR
jgi:hypothetical protein